MPSTIDLTGEPWASLLLENASEVHGKRVIPGCEKRPKEWLVGVELNPGPPKRVLGDKGPLGNLIGELGSLVSPPSMKRGQAKKKKKNTSAPVRSVGGVMNSAPLGSTNVVSAPTRAGTLTVQRAAGSHVVRVPFNSISNTQLIFITGNTRVGFSTTAANTVSVQTYDLRPGINRDGYTALDYPFGVGIARIATCYTKYRVKRLRVTFVSTSPTSFSGSILLGANSDPQENSVPTPQNVADSQVSITTPAWQPCEMRLDSLLDPNLWYFTEYDGSGNTVSSQRQQCPLQLSVSSIGTSTATAVYGYLRFDGEIEFTGINDERADLPAAFVEVPQQTRPHPLVVPTPRF